MKSKVLAAFLCFALLLTGCAAAPAEPTATSPLASVDHNLDAANSYLLSGNFYRFLPYKNFCYKFDHLKSLILYYDCDSGTSGPLCADPDCTHNSLECSAYVVQGDGLNCYQENLYFVSKDVSAVQTDPNDYLWKTSLSGENRQKVKCFDFNTVIQEYQPQQYIIHQGQLYLIGYAYIVQGGKGLTRLSVLSTTLDDSETFTPIFQLETEADIKYSVRFVGDSVYIFSALQGTAKVVRYDISTQSSATIYEESAISDLLGELWVSEDGTVYLAGADDDAGYVWTLTDHARQVAVRFDIPEKNVPKLTGDIAVVLTRDADGNRQASVKDLSGATIYDGPLFPSDISGLDVDPNNCYYGLLGGNKDQIVIELDTTMDTHEAAYCVLFLDPSSQMQLLHLWSCKAYEKMFP